MAKVSTPQAQVNPSTFGGSSGGSSGGVGTDKIHPPKEDVLDMFNWKNPGLHLNVMESGSDLNEGIKSVGDWQADNLGNATIADTDKTYKEMWRFPGDSDEQRDAFGDQFGLLFQGPVGDWMDDWGGDLVGGADWTEHGGERKTKVSDPYITKAEIAIGTADDEIGPGPSSEDKLVDSVWKGYKNGIVYTDLERWANNAADGYLEAMVEEGETTYNLGGDFILSGGTGHWGTYQKEMDTIATDYEDDVTREDRDMLIEERDLESEERSRLDTLKTQSKTSGNFMRRRGGGGFGGQGRGFTQDARDLRRELSSKRELARTTYEGNLETLDYERTIDEADEGTDLKREVENTIFGLKVSLEAAELEYEDASVKQEDDASTRVITMLGDLQSGDPDWPMPGGVHEDYTSSDPDSIYYQAPYTGTGLQEGDDPANPYGEEIQTAVADTRGCGAIAAGCGVLCITSLWGKGCYNSCMSRNGC